MKLKWFYGDSENAKNLEIEESEILDCGSVNAAVEHLNDILLEEFQKSIYPYFDNEESLKEEIKKLFKNHGKVLSRGI